MDMKWFVVIAICLNASLLRAEEDESLWDSIWGHGDEEQKEHALHDVHQYYGSGLFNTFSANEIQFQLFDAHDYDRNGKLDGLELLTAMHHSEHQHTAKATPSQPIVNNPQPTHPKTFESDVAMIDSMMQLDDLDNDGYLDYAEFVSAADRNPKSKVIKSINMEKH